MGLDMYLRLKHRADFDKSFETFDNAHGSQWQCKEKIYDVQYWRKANAIHKWFVDNVQHGEDDCGRYHVTVDNLKQLRSDCRNAMEYFDDRNIEEAAEFMPTQEGFFFGSTEYDEWYREDLQRTFDACNNLIKTIEAPGRSDWLMVEYESSW